MLDNGRPRHLDTPVRATRFCEPDEKPLMLRQKVGTGPECRKGPARWDEDGSESRGADSRG